VLVLDLLAAPCPSCGRALRHKRAAEPHALRA
jgi:hypothetical protein